CCEELAQKWDVSVKDYRVSVTANELGDRLTPLVQRGLRQALEQARTAVHKPALSDVREEIGKSAMLLLPVMVQAPWAGWPLFVVQALKPVFAYLVDRVKDRAHDLQFAVTDKLSQLAKRAGSEFENEVRLRISDLHKWQDRAVESAARQQAEQLIRWLGGPRLMKNLFGGVLLVLVIARLCGARCNRPGGKVTVPSKPLTKLEYFKEKQAATMTPHGTIDMNSVKETSEGV